jgi:hypothetical protein
MTNDTQPECPANAAQLRQIARAIPDTTPSARLLPLQARYAKPRDPMIAALPAQYRHAGDFCLRAIIAGLPGPAPMP